MVTRDATTPLRVHTTPCEASVCVRMCVKQNGKLSLDPSLGQRPFSFPYLDLCLDSSVICLSKRTCTTSQLHPYLILYLTSLAIRGARLGQIITAGYQAGPLMFISATEGLVE